MDPVRLVLACLAVLLGAPLSVAQPFPAPGTGVFTWERVGDRPLSVAGFSFSPGGRLVAADDSVWAFEPDPAGPPAGRWVGLGEPGGIVRAVLTLDADADTLLVGNGNGGRTTRSTDGGATWAVVNGGGGVEPGGPNAPNGFFVVPPGHPNAGRLLAGGVVIYSDDRGATWPDAAQDVPTNSQSFAQTFAVLPSGRVLAGTGGGVLASADGGASYLRTPLWGPYSLDALAPLATPGSAQSGAPSCGLPDPTLCDGAVAVGFSTQLPGARAWRTNDGGQTWSESVHLPEPFDGAAAAVAVGVIALGVGPDGLGRAIAVLGRGVVYATADGGQTWAAVGRMPIRLDAGSHFPHLARLGPDGHVWVSTTINSASEREWVYRSAEPAEAALPVAGEVGPGVPSEVGVSVRPNPAGGRVEVAVTLSEGGPVRVVVVDALGREVAVVVSGEASAGERVAVVDVSGWPAGVYVVRATAGAGVASARLVVAR